MTPDYIHVNNIWFELFIACFFRNLTSDLQILWEPASEWGNFLWSHFLGEKMLLEPERLSDKSLDALRLKWTLEIDEASEDVDKLDEERRCLSLESSEMVWLLVNPVVELENRWTLLTSAGVAPFLISAESRLRVCWSFLFARVFEPDEEQEKTLFIPAMIWDTDWRPKHNPHVNLTDWLNNRWWRLAVNDRCKHVFYQENDLY